MNDNQIIKLFFTRNEDAIQQTAYKYGTRLTGLAANIVRNNEDAQECVNDTYLKAWDTIPPTKPEHFFAYLAKICRYFSFGRLDWNNAAKRNAEVVALTQDYLVDGEEAAGLFCSDILTDEEWYFDVTFDPDNQFIELITHPVSAQAKVWRYADEKQWETKDSLEEVQISSFRVTPFGANIFYIPKPDTIGISPRLEKEMGDTIYAVMKDGSRIKLDSAGNDVLRAETPIVLSQLDYILLEDGTKLFAPSIQP